MRPRGIGADEALRLWADVLGPACLSVDHPRYLSFIPSAPTKAAAAFDMLVGASNVYAGSWLEGSGAVYAENQALRWIADLAGLPADGRRGVRAGRHGRQPVRAGRRPRGRAGAARRPPRPLGGLRHRGDALVGQARAAGRDGRRRRRDPRRRAGPDDRRGAAPDGLRSFRRHGRRHLRRRRHRRDDEPRRRRRHRRASPTWRAEHGWWLHVDGAYGGAGLAAPCVRHLFAGVERADSFIVDPHKWLFAPFDSCALLYRDPVLGRAAHTQHAGYLDPVTVEGEWNPSDFAIQLTRRARGLPFWFSLAVHGTDAYRERSSRRSTVARAGAALIRAAEHVRLLVEPDLSVLMFERIGWTSRRLRALGSPTARTSRSLSSRPPGTAIGRARGSRSSTR